MSYNLTWKEVMAVQLANRSQGLVLFESSLMLLINLISAIGNVTLCYVVYKTPFLHTKTNMYIIALALSDTLMAFLVMPLTVAVLIQGKWIFGNQVCQIQGFISLSLALISLQTMALIAINRYFCVVRPSIYRIVFKKKWFLVMIVGIWAVALFVAMVPLIFQIGSFRFMAGRSSCFISIPDFVPNITYTSFCLFFFVLIPFSVMVCCYTLVFRKIHQHKANNTLHVPAHGRAEEIKTTRLLFALVVGFSACWIPCIVIELTESVLPGGALSRSSYIAYIYLGYLSSAINPVLYGTLNRPFRRATKRQLLWCFRSNVVHVRRMFFARAIRENTN